MKLDPKKKVAGEFSSADTWARGVITANKDAIQRLAILADLQISAQKLPDSGGGMRSTAQFDLHIPYASETVDAVAERTRINKEIEGLRKAITSKEAQLGNETFRSKAPENIIKQMQEALVTQRVEFQKLMDRLKQLRDN
jgi:valyl-tRNA synthetase